MKFSSSFTTTNLRFCDKTVQNIVTASFKQSILDTLFKRYSFIVNQKRYRTYHNKYESKLTHHLLTTISGGSDYLFFATTDPVTQVPISLFIDCTIQKHHEYPKMIILHTRFSPEIYNNTLLLGKLNCNIHKQWSFIISDMIIYQGTLVTQNLLQRLSMIQTMLSEQYQSDTILQSIPFLMKRYFNMKDYQTVCSEYIPSLPYKTIGLYFSPVSYGEKPFFYYFSKTIPFHQIPITQEPETTIIAPKKQTFNISKQSTNNVTVTIKKKNAKQTRLVAYLKPTRTPEIYKLCVRNQTKLKKIGYAHISSLSMNQQIKEQFQAENAVSKLIVMCDYNSQFNKWSPTSIESDSSQVMSLDAYQQLMIQ